MTLDLVAILRSAWARLRADHVLLLPMAGLTMFLPQFGLLLLVEAPTLEKGDGSTAATAAQAQVVLDWAVKNSGWYLAAYLCAFYGVLVILSLYLDRRRPDLKTALGHAGRLLPRYLLSVVLVGLPVGLGIGLLGPVLGAAMVILLVPAFYWIVRTMLAGAVIVAERPIGAAPAVRRSLALTRGHGLVLAALIAFVTFAGELVAQIFVSLGALMTAADAANPIAMALVDGLAAIVQATAALLLVLIQVEFYRRLSAGQAPAK
ncbi:hypothetical protein ACFO8O_00595 [Hephaestia sp. GCM10023244]|uniref:hypothetical protein n=1 Tax=unclassified Hephaestia TaxID=2631281 RepID=UPI002077715D|nr:hypothetical protein [Hephaestia sp. MAHUQ-44]MCM8729466.1 hypothetical protein [Hephaestia sp. MAHUQ-44]